jgi:hypothetical protein
MEDFVQWAFMDINGMVNEEYKIYVLEHLKFNVITVNVCVEDINELFIEKL